MYTWIRRSNSSISKKVKILKTKRFLKIRKMRYIDMAYDVTKEKQVVIAQIKKNDRGEMIQVSRLIPLVDKTRQESMDFRLMFTKENGELSPTSKGVRFNMNQYKEFLAGIVKMATDEEKAVIKEALGEA